MKLTIDRCIELLQAAKKEIGGDKPVVITHNHQFIYVNDYGEDPIEEIYFAHLSAIPPRDNFGFSTVDCKWFDMPKAVLKDGQWVSQYEKGKHYESTEA